MLIDLHAHTSGISSCCRYDALKVIETARNAGIDGIVLTNHYQKSYIKDDGVDAFIKKYMDEFYYTKKLGEEAGIKVFWGIEVTMVLYPNVHMLIYGVDAEFLKKNPFLFDCTQKELYDLVKANNGVLIQAHPFRNGATVLDTDLLDGVEINCHPKYKKSYCEELLEIGKENNLIVVCGGDFHADTYRPKCGVNIPPEITDSVKLGEYLKTAEKIELFVQEPDTDICQEIDYNR